MHFQAQLSTNPDLCLSKLSRIFHYDGDKKEISCRHRWYLGGKVSGSRNGISLWKASYPPSFLLHRLRIYSDGVIQYDHFSATASFLKLSIWRGISYMQMKNVSRRNSLNSKWVRWHNIKTVFQELDQNNKIHHFYHFTSSKDLSTVNSITEMRRHYLCFVILVWNLRDSVSVSGGMIRKKVNTMNNVRDFLWLFWIFQSEVFYDFSIFWVQLKEKRLNLLISSIYLKWKLCISPWWFLCRVVGYLHN